MATLFNNHPHISSSGTPVGTKFSATYVGGWSYYYMHGAAPITQYMAASTTFNPLSQQIIIYVRAKLYVMTSSIT